MWAIPRDMLHAFAPARLLPGRPACARGLSTLELLVSAAIISIVASISLVGLSKAQKTRGATYCSSNLRSIGMAFQNYAIDNQGFLPNTVGTNTQWEDSLRKYVHRTTFQCPSDNELFVSLGSSYDWRDTGNPDTTLVGRQLMVAIRGQVALSFEGLPGWHRRNMVQVVNLDGSVIVINQDTLLQDLTTPVLHY